MATYVTQFSEGNKDQKDLLGGKGANLAEMVNMGLPVPPGFTISTEACKAYLEKCLACFHHDEGFVQGMLAAGVTDPPEIARRLIRNVGGTEPAHLFLPLYTITEFIRRSDIR